MPKEAKILLVEDDQDYGETLGVFLSRGGHKVVRWAKDYDGALEAIDNIGQDGVNTVILDGNLTEGESSGGDGRTILGKIRERYPDLKSVKVVWNSSSDVGDKAPLANISKRVSRSSELAEVITKL